MGELYRFGISLEKELLDEFDARITAKKYPNRSEAIRDLIRKEITSEKWIKGGKVAGAIVMTYDHHKRDLVTKLMDIQHEYHDSIISSQHVHLDHHSCLEIIAVKGCSKVLEQLVMAIKANSGVTHVSLSLSMTGASSGTSAAIVKRDFQITPSE